MIILSKLKFDLRDPAEVYLAKREIESLLNTETQLVKTIASLFKKEPFCFLDDEVIHIINRLVYLGEAQGFLASISPCNILDLVVKRTTFFREIYVIIETQNNKELLNLLKKIGINLKTEILKQTKLSYNFYTQIFIKNSTDEKSELVTIRFLPFQPLFEYATEVKKLPAVVFRPKNNSNWKEYFKEKESGIEKGIQELIEHLNNEYYRSPHFGLGKNNIGDFIDWASTDLRKPFLHYLHKYKGKGDPRISRALINLLKVKEGDTILDPFVGSGAFIADAPSMGINAVGIEVLNIGKLIAEVKCNLAIDTRSLREAIIKIFEQINENSLNQEIKNQSIEIKEKIIKNSSESVYKRLEPHLSKILLLKNLIENIEDSDIKNLLLVLLSQQIVEYSEKSRTYEFLASFKSYVEDRYLVLYSTKKLAELIGVNLHENKVRIIKGDSTNMSMLKDSSIDGIITSPPYFDALDYIGNNKISILVLGLDDDLAWRSTKEFYDAKNRDEKNYESLPLFVSDRYFSIELPESSLSLIKLLEQSKRFYKAKIVENYLKMMKLSFKECFRVLKRGKYYLMVISKYHSWMINGKEELIETSPILADLGKSEGFKLVDTIEHGLSKADKGKIDVEDILIFQK